MNKLLLLITFFFLICLTIGAQDSYEQDFSGFEELFIQNQTVFNASNIAYVTQLAESINILTFQQNKEDFSNKVFSEQKGIGNNGYISQGGSMHATNLQQKGSNNEANIWSVGQNTFSEVLQKGDDNKVNSYIDNQGFFVKSALIQQTGNNNLIELALLGDGYLQDGANKSAFITQNGNGLEISAILDTYKSPIKVEQQSGPTGEGMKINISNSDFYFPMK